MRNVVGITGNTTPRQWPGWSASGSPQQSIVYWALLLGQKIILSIGERYPTHAHVHLDVVLAELGKMKVLEISPLIRNSLHSALRKAFFSCSFVYNVPFPENRDTKTKQQFPSAQFLSHFFGKSGALEVLFLY